MPRVKPESIEGTGITPETAEVLRDPAVSLPMLAYVADQASPEEVKYDPFAITKQLQQTIVKYVSEPPMTEDGYARWLCVLKYRQGGASTSGVLAFYPKISYHDNWEHLTIADTLERADGLHERQMLCHNKWDLRFRRKQITAIERRSLSLINGSKSKVASAHAEAIGIGRSVSSLLASEVPFWRDAGEQFSLIGPAMYNRRHAMLIQESTPSTMDAPSADFWKMQCEDARYGRGRDLFAFFPFWDGLLNRRPWPTGSVLDPEEEALIAEFGHLGLELENLAFRRFVLEQDKTIRRDHDLFDVYYPCNMVRCWKQSGRGIIPARALARHTRKQLVPWTPGDEVIEYHPPKPDATYVIAVDPAGWTGETPADQDSAQSTDHAAFHVFEVWDDEWVQVATYANHTNPIAIGEKLFATGMRYNRALIGVERNGVGLALVVALKMLKYPNLHHDRNFLPGINKSDDEWEQLLVDALMDKITLYDEDTVNQCQGYKSDKRVRIQAKSLVLGHKTTRRRRKHHWDKVSALMVAAALCPYAPRRYRAARDELPKNVLPFSQLGYNDLRDFERLVAADKARQEGRTRPRYVSVRKRRK